MNLHPLVVHFPVALRFLYCSILILQVVWWRDRKDLNTIKYFCLFVWTLTWFLALQTWESALEIYGKSALIHTHEQRWEMLYNLLIVVSILTAYSLQKRTIKYEWDSTVRTIVPKLLDYRVMGLVGVVGIVMLTIVWSLGGAISRGTAGDPVAKRAVEYLVPSEGSQK
jgi:uncharacterized membrane protein